ncbi:hypothetical protein [Blastococcus brunescens]|uniref:Integral membrane protein n=1 Tax=Blastococcus brunescens TaxID=1564165 RepID=A0ABZ1B564_9ACTN|nr:hypothetical protein [Blastococcus sp. BMG 8361]WRL65955.1 hypothetical protein U6N30_10590 [Blastococcus sp. BMG 8361]
MTVVGLGLFVTGVGPRPAGAIWASVYDLGLYNVVYAGAALVCLLAARRPGPDRLAWVSLTIAILLGVVGNLVYTLVVARLDEEPFPRSPTSSTSATTCRCTSP